MVILSKYIAIEVGAVFYRRDLASTLFALGFEETQDRFGILLNVRKYPMRRVLYCLCYNEVLLFTFAFQSRMCNGTCLHFHTASLHW